MQTFLEMKEADTTSTPLLLFDAVLSDGSKFHWCSQRCTVNGNSYEPRVWRNNLFEIQTASDQGVDSIPKITLELANADSVLAEVERSIGFKGARVTCSFVFYNGVSQTADAAALVLFQGVFNSPESITESIFRISALNRLSAQKVVLPALRVQRRCSWSFPATAVERAEAVSGGTLGERSRFYPCGYSADQPGGVGNLNGGTPYTSCTFTRADCQTRGMFNTDSRGQTTARFSGIEFVPSTITVRSAGEKGSHASPVSLNETRYNDFIPLVYGTAWYTPGVVFARNDGNLTRIEVLLGVGEMQEIQKVLVSDIEIPLGHSGQNMTGTGWFNVVTMGGRNGGFNHDFTDGAGKPLGDPYGSLAYCSVVVPNRINDGKSLPVIKVLADGLKLAKFDLTGASLGKAFSNNPAWMILDVLLRNGWAEQEIDLVSFAQAAAYCDQSIPAKDLLGNAIQIPRFQCNVVLQSRRSAGDVLRGIRNSSRLFLTFGQAGLLQLKSENTVAGQQSTVSSFSNATELLNGGWPAYEFGDGTQGTSGILRNSDGSSTFQLSCRAASDTPNRFSVEFQDALNEYQQDSFSVSDSEDITKAGQEINSSPTVIGLPNFNQAARILQFLLNKSVQGNLQIVFQTSVKAFGIAPGDILAITYLKAGFTRQAFRVLKIAPGQNFRNVTITAQIHDDAWYSDVFVDQSGAARRLLTANLGLPRPISGVTADDSGSLQFGIMESAVVAQDGTAAVLLDVEIAIPPPIAESAPAIPIVSLTPQFTIQSNGLSSSAVVYYSISAVDANAKEGMLSFVVRAAIPSGGGTYAVTLGPLNFSANTAAFHVYRGITPQQMIRIATGVPVASSFQDTGFTATDQLPPDINFHHSNLYWRLESESEANATIHSLSSVGNSALSMKLNAYAGFAVRLTQGTGAGQERVVASNSAIELSLVTPWDIEPDATSMFAVSQSAFQLGATGQGHHFQFQVPNREGTVVQILGRSANAAGAECPTEISPLTRWKIGGAGIRTVDAAISGAPLFALGLAPSLNGTLELSGLGFADLANTSSIVAGTLTVHAQDELSSAEAATLSADLGVSDTVLPVSGISGLTKDTIVRLSKELMLVSDVATDGTVLIQRGVFGTSAVSSTAGQNVVVLTRFVFTMPFIRNFFGTPASGDWKYTIPLPSSRVAAADFYVTNSQGNSPNTTQAYTGTLDNGLRTLSGGQYSFQIAGPLAVENAAIPEVVLETDHVIGDVSAYLNQAPMGSGAEIRLTLNSTPVCNLRFGDGSQVSTGVRGADLPVMRQGDRLGLDVMSIGSTLPGSDLTVTVRI